MADQVTTMLTGGCNCGAVRYAVTSPLLGAGYCHCRRCQRRTGTAVSASASAAPGTFEIRAGEEVLRAWKPADGWEKWFCGECGSHIFSRDPNDHGRVGIRMGSFDEDPGVRLSSRQFVAYAARWEPIPADGLPRYPEARPGGGITVER
jgi:hypothetical protein